MANRTLSDDIIGEVMTKSETAPAGSMEPLPARMQVVVARGPDEGKTLTLSAGRHLVGKSKTCALVLSDAKVSRQHLELAVTEKGIIVRDLGSKNGSFLQGARFTEIMVGVGGAVQLGDSTLRFDAVDPAISSTRSSFGRLRGSSPAMRRVYALLERAADSDATVLIGGETGVGKELCAEALHQESARKKGPFVVCDAAGLARSVIESELFGHMRGAFTGATSDRAGAFESAHGGTLFIDEVGELEASMQPRLLRAIEQKQVKRIGDDKYRKVDVRLVAATNRDLRAEVKAGRFREDLYQRLAVLKVTIPPLREHKQDLPELVETILGNRRVTIPPATLDLFAAYDWPGNVRELRNVLDGALSLLGAGKILDPRFLGLEVQPKKSTEKDFFAARERLLATWEKQYLVEVLAQTGGNVSHAARRAGIDRIHLHRLIKKYGLGGAGRA